MIRLSFLLLAFSFWAFAEETVVSARRIEEYKPMYFLMGTPDTKIQIGAKLKAADTTNFYFGYTQLMMWNLFQHSPFFRDVNYNPEFFYRFYLNDDNKEEWLDFGVYEHESNGKGGANERSWNRTSLRYHTLQDLGETTKLYFSFKAWVPYWYNNANHDIIHYRGLWEMYATLTDLFDNGLFQRSDLTLRLYPGGWAGLDPTKGGQELTLYFRFRGVRFLPTFVMQVFNGYGENLIDYTTNRFGARIGMGF